MRYYNVCAPAEAAICLARLTVISDNNNSNSLNIITAYIIILCSLALYVSIV